MKLTSTLFVLSSIVGVTYGKLFPQIALGGAGGEFEYRLVVQVSNVTSGRWEGDLVLLPTNTSWDDDANWPGEWAVNGISQTGKSSYLVPEIPPHGTTVLSVTGGSELHTGALLIHSDDSWNRNAGGVAVSVTYQVLRDDVLIDAVGVPSNAYHPTENQTIVIPISRKAGDHNTGFAFVLMGGSHRRLSGYRNDIVATLYDADGVRLEFANLRLGSPPPQVDHLHSAKFIDEVFRGIEAVTADEFTGTLHLRSAYGSSLSAMGLRIDWLEDGSIQITSVPISTFRH